MSRGAGRVCVFASGGGSNLGALFTDADKRGHGSGAQVTLVVSNRPDAGALSRAADRGVPTAVVAPEDDEATLHRLLSSHSIDLIVLAGYLRLVPPGITAAYRGRIVNIHPALLPAFGGSGMFGRRVHRAVLDSGVRVTGATVHFVDEHYDRGPIIAQWPVPVFAGDTAETLAERVLRAEHALLPPVVEAIATGRIRLGDDGRVEGLAAVSNGSSAAFVFASPNADLAEGVTRSLALDDSGRG